MQIGIIPARENSTRFPRKLLHQIGKKALLTHTIERALTFGLDEIFVATDSAEIAQLAKKSGAEIIMTSSQPTSGTERVREAVRSSKYLSSAHVIVNIQGDHPLTGKDTVQSMLSALKDDPFSEIVTAVSLLTDLNMIASPSVVKCVFDHMGHALYFSRSPIPFNGDIYYHHLGIYAYKRRFFERKLRKSHLEEREKLEQLSFLENGLKMKVVVTKDSALGVDTPPDVKLLEALL